MREDDGRKLDHKTLEQLRIRAVGQIQQGAHPDEVAAGLGMTRAAVYGWLAKYREGGLEALTARPVPGRPSKLSGAQLARLYGLVVGNDPRQLRFAFALWTRAMVRELIRREFGVALSEVSVGRLLRSLGLSPQRPLYRAYQQNPEAVRRWKTEEYPSIPAAAKQAGATIYFADEAGVRSDYHAGTTWAPVGPTPVVATTGDRFGVNLISAVTARGKLRLPPMRAARTVRCSSTSAVGCCTTPQAQCFWSLMAIRCTAPTRSNSSPPRLAAGCACSSCRATHRNGTRASGCGSTSSTTGSAGPGSAAPRISKPRRWRRSSGCKGYRTWYAASSVTRTCATSLPDQSTYLLSPW
jgi:transposase